MIRKLSGLRVIEPKDLIAGGLVEDVRRVCNGFNFEDARTPPQLFDKMPAFQGSSVIHPFKELKFENTNVSLRLR